MTLGGGGGGGGAKLVCLRLHIAASSEYSITNIEHKFMISGHSFLPRFGHIELSRKKTQHIYMPRNWEQVVPFRVFRMKRLKEMISSL